jgi:hypothetical protein
MKKNEKLMKRNIEKIYDNLILFLLGVKNFMQKSEYSEKV